MRFTRLICDLHDFSYSQSESAIAAEFQMILVVMLWGHNTLLRAGIWGKNCRQPHRVKRTMKMFVSSPISANISLLIRASHEKNRKDISLIDPQSQKKKKKARLYISCVLLPCVHLPQ
jgi:hypothetical protein